MSYGTPADGDTYFASHMFATAWESADEPLKTKALAHASRIIDTLPFVGDKPEGQEDEFPRVGQDSVPAYVSYATYEIALCLLEGKNPEQERAMSGMKKYEFDVLRVEYFKSSSNPARELGLVSNTAYAYLQPYIVDQTTIKLRRTS